MKFLVGVNLYTKPTDDQQNALVFEWASPEEWRAKYLKAKAQRD
jgi:hypothetical protein